MYFCAVIYTLLWWLLPIIRGDHCRRHAKNKTIRLMITNHRKIESARHRTVPTLLHLFIFSFFILSFLSSCSTPYNVAYFQDMPLEKQLPITPPRSVRLMPADKISILVSTRDASLSSLFSLYSNYTIGSTGNVGGSTNYQRPSEYTVGSDGMIDFPVLGRIEVAGKTREEVQFFIKQQLIDQNLVKDPIVTVEFSNLYVTMIGAAGSVGRIEIDRDQFTLLDAISQSGDLQITGQRENIRVIREVAPDQLVSYEVNLCSAEDLYNSPVYYLQQNDVIYIEPNNKVKRTSTEYGSQMVQYTFWMGLVSSALTLIAIFK